MAGKFWGSLSFWKVLLIFLITNVVMQLIAVLLREGLGIAWATSIGAGAGGGAAAVVIVNALANKQRSSEPGPH